MLTRLFSRTGINGRLYIDVFLTLMVLFNLAGVLVYIMLRTFFYEVPMDWKVELVTVGKVLGVASVAAAVITTVTILADVVEYLLIGKKQKLTTVAKMIYVGFIVLTGYLMYQG